MTEQLLKQMISIVDATMESYKSDFYQYDLVQLCKTGYEPSSFLWRVGKHGTHLEILDYERQKEYWSETEWKRFSIMSFPENIGCHIQYSYDGDFYLYEDGELKKCNQRKEELLKLFGPIRAKVVNYIRNNYPEEAPYYGSKVPVHFASPEVMSDFLAIVRTDEGKELLSVVKDSFRRYIRYAIDHKIVIGYDYTPESFSFWVEQNGKVTMNGGILYHNPQHDESMAVCLDEIHEPCWRIHT